MFKKVTALNIFGKPLRSIVIDTSKVVAIERKKHSEDKDPEVEDVFNFYMEGGLVLPVCIKAEDLSTLLQRPVDGLQ
jgi:hypothetical protein